VSVIDSSFGRVVGALHMGEIVYWTLFTLTSVIQRSTGWSSSSSVFASNSAKWRFTLLEALTRCASVSVCMCVPRIIITREIPVYNVPPPHICAPASPVLFLASRSKSIDCAARRHIRPHGGVTCATPVLHICLCVWMHRGRKQAEEGGMRASRIGHKDRASISRNSISRDTHRYPDMRVHISRRYGGGASRFELYGRCFRCTSTLHIVGIVKVTVVW